MTFSHDSNKKANKIEISKCDRTDTGDVATSLFIRIQLLLHLTPTQTSKRDLSRVASFDQINYELNKKLRVSQCCLVLFNGLTEILDNFSSHGKTRETSRSASSSLWLRVVLMTSVLTFDRLIFLVLQHAAEFKKSSIKQTSNEFFCSFLTLIRRLIAYVSDTLHYCIFPSNFIPNAIRYQQHSF